MAVCSSGLCCECLLGLLCNVFDLNDFNGGLWDVVFELSGVDVYFGESK